MILEMAVHGGRVTVHTGAALAVRGRTACFTEVYIISNLSLSQLYTDIRATKAEVYNAIIAAN